LIVCVYRTVNKYSDGKTSDARPPRCIHGLGLAEAQHALGPLSGVTSMDPLERAVRAGEDREAAKSEMEPRCVSGERLAGWRLVVGGLGPMVGGSGWRLEARDATRERQERDKAPLRVGWVRSDGWGSVVGRPVVGRLEVGSLL
jgi:hypothetical protein